MTDMGKLEAFQGQIHLRIKTSVDAFQLSRVSTSRASLRAVLGTTGARILLKCLGPGRGRHLTCVPTCALEGQSGVDQSTGNSHRSEDLKGQPENVSDRPKALTTQINHRDFIENK